ncbi:hypothetical protein [Paraliomyxa miuraensis]|uniref:hypothetical protein n=1 Tax=Paraliomyxa miuraensis TaxID=376150 RepID=UPI00225BD761|nr:hypothetical protein [Paraliomyxa miuraensis]MCX4241458.1 hypothetical protein [Paraliomyxa miuraensis]
MRVALAITVRSTLPLALLAAMPSAGCSEPNPNFSVAMWFDGVEESRPTEQGLHPGPNSSAPGEWSTTTSMANNGDTAWHFGDGTTYPRLSNASLLTPEFDAGSTSFLRFSYYSDIQPLSDSTATDGLVVEAQVEGGEWTSLEPHGGFTHTLDQVVLGSQLSLGEGVLSGNDRQWHDDYVELGDTEPRDQVRFRFRFGCDIDESNNIGSGFFIDDVEFLVIE